MSLLEICDLKILFVVNDVLYLCSCDINNSKSVIMLCKLGKKKELFIS